MKDFCRSAPTTRMDVCSDKTLKEKKPFANGWQRHTEPPKFMVANFIAQDDFVTALDIITNEGRRRESGSLLYCDV